MVDSVLYATDIAYDENKILKCRKRNSSCILIYNFSPKMDFVAYAFKFMSAMLPAKYS